MYVQQQQRCLLLFEESIKSPNTKALYLHHLNKFMKFREVGDLTKLISLPEHEIQVMLEDYLIYLKKSLSPNTIPVAMAPLELFFTINDKNCNFKKIRKMFPAPIRKTGTKSWTTQDIQKMLASTSKKRTKFLIHFLASTGCRIGVVEELKLKNLEDLEMNCKAVQFYEGTNEEYWGFLTPEANKALDEYVEERRVRGESLEPNSPLFLAGSDSSGKFLTLSKKVAQLILNRCIQNAQITRQKTGKRYDIQIAHGFRKRFNTVLKMNREINSNITEKLMAHKNGLDGVYFTPTREECFMEFRKAIPGLTVDDSERLLLRNKELEEKISTQTKLEEENKDLKERVVNVENDLQKVLKRQEITEKYKKISSTEFADHVPQNK